ncbi:MAG: hypothetical protein WA697_08070 [Pseudolabrys sp.]
MSKMFISAFRSVKLTFKATAIRTLQLLVHADARLLLETVLPGFGGLYPCLIRQPSKQNLAFNLHGRRELNLFSKPPSQDFHLPLLYLTAMYRAPPPPPDSNAHLVWVTFLEHDEQAILTGWICFDFRHRRNVDKARA